MKILIIDDEFVSRKKIERLIQSLGHETVATVNGKEGLEIWKNEGFRMVITDWNMPEIDGLSLCRIIRESEGGQYTYIIMVTTRNATNDIVAGIDAGADDFISKPFIKEELAVRIRSGERILSLATKDIVIFSMAKLAESRDPETGQHLERVRYYSKLLAETAAGIDNFSQDINKTFIDNIFLSSPLHDIGKIGIPDSILLKSARLDEREFETMKKHTLIGFNTINESSKKYSKADYLKMSAEIALSHHEKFDGSGYPYSLKENEIPISARIVALADIYDVLISKRVYKEAYTHDIARDIIIKEQGTHLDPELVKVFLSVNNKFVEISKKFGINH
ncbi:MAG: response regulator [Planctomycetes bacterium]|nr:response regulator [Planctomycetota bacterium]